MAQGWLHLIFINLISQLISTLRLFQILRLRKAGVNHVLIFELDPRNHLSEQHLLELAAVLGVSWTLSVLAFLYSSSLGIPAYVNPLILVVTMVLFLLNPTRTYMYQARFWFLRKLVFFVFV